jgi:transposase
MITTRELKGMELAARARITLKGDVWLVPSQTSRSKWYNVRLHADNLFCSCEDFANTASPCKHIYAARLVQTREKGIESHPVDTDSIPIRKSYPQNWPKYTQSQMTESERFQDLLYALCKGINEPPHSKTGRPRTPMADMVFAVALKVYTTFSARRFAGALRLAIKKGYVSSAKMHSISVCAYLGKDIMTPVLQELIKQSSLPFKAIEKDFAVDATGFSTSRIGRWYDDKYGCERTGREFVLAEAMTGVRSNIVTAVKFLGIAAGESPQFKTLVQKTAENFRIRDVSADKAYLSHENLGAVAQLGGTPYIPFKCNSLPGEPNSLWEKMFLYYAYRREDFLKHYHQRSNIETTFMMVKSKFGDFVRSELDTSIQNEVLAKFVCHNLAVVDRSHVVMGLEPVFWPDKEQQQAETT